MKKSISSIIWGLVIVAVGVLFLGNSINWWDVKLFFDGWWTLFIIIPSIIGLFDKGNFRTSIIFLAIGILALLASQNVINWDMAWGIFVPVVIIVIGLSLIFKTNIDKKLKEKMSKKNLECYTAIFSGSEDVINNKFEGATCTAVFGGLDLDLKDAKIDDDIIITVVSVFGGIDIKMPQNVKVKLSGTPLFGGVDNKYVSAQDEAPTVYINYVCVFGGIDLK